MDIKDLRTQDPDKFERLYQQWHQDMTEMYEHDLGYLASLAAEKLKGTGWVVDGESVQLQLAYSQGDGVGIDATFYPEKCDLNHPAIRDVHSRYPLLMEIAANKCDVVSETLSVWTMHANRSAHSLTKWDSELPWLVEEPEDHTLDFCSTPLKGGIYHGMPLLTAVQIAFESPDPSFEHADPYELIEKFADDLCDIVRDVAHEIYVAARDDYESRCSEDEFMYHCEEGFYDWKEDDDED